MTLLRLRQLPGAAPARSVGRGDSPLASVRDAIAAGHVGRLAIARITSLEPETVELAIEQLEAAGELSREPLGCEASACASCAWTTGCPAHVPGRRVPVALKLRRRQAES